MASIRSDIFAGIAVEEFSEGVKIKEIIKGSAADRAGLRIGGFLEKAVVHVRRGGESVKVELAPPSLFARKFGSVGETLLAALPIFSRDVVGVVAAYVVCGTATAMAQPQLLTSFTLPDLTNCAALAISPLTGDLWIVGSERGHLVVCDTDGRSLSTVLHPELRGAVAIAFASDGRAFVSARADENGRVVVLNPDRSLQRVIGAKGPDGFRHLPNPRGLAVAKAEHNGKEQELLFVADAGNKSVVVFNLDGTFVRVLGGCEFLLPCGVAVSEAGEVYVSDENYGNSIRVFDATGKLVRSMTNNLRRRVSMPVQLCPAGLAVDRMEQAIFCKPTEKRLHHRVYVAREGDVFEVTRFDVSDPLACVCVDREGRILVGYSTQPRVDVFVFPLFDHGSAQKMA